MRRKTQDRNRRLLERLDHLENLHYGKAERIAEVQRREQANRDRGRHTNNVGRQNELRVLEAITKSLSPLPVWLLGMRAGTPEEDARGIDAVITTDVGKIFVQVKSSWAEANKFRNEHGVKALEFVIIVVRPGATPVTLRDEILRQTIELRERILAGRRHSN